MGVGPVLHQEPGHGSVSNDGQHVGGEDYARAVADGPVNKQEGVIGHVGVVVKGCQALQALQGLCHNG